MHIVTIVTVMTTLKLKDGIKKRRKGNTNAMDEIARIYQYGYGEKKMRPKQKDGVNAPKKHMSNHVE